MTVKEEYTTIEGGYGMQDKTTRWIVGGLLLSGGLHLLLWYFSGQTWEGAVSLRKPALFGISGGLTVWSLIWVTTKLSPRVRDAFWSRVTAWSLLGEVGLITLQYWRGVPSHFNHSTVWNSVIERTMVLLILVVTWSITRLCLHSMRPMNASPTMALAIRSGMLLLWLSCLLGVGTSAIGQWNLHHGQPYETWGKAGVLKFPHGIALHAIQLLPLCAWLIERIKLPRPYLAMQGIAASQWIFLLFAVWQTWQGRARFDMDATGATLFGAAMLCALVPLVCNFLAPRRKELQVANASGQVKTSQQ